jgi:type I restriction enzyme S subunit
MVPNGWQKGLFKEGIELISGQHVEADLVNTVGIGHPYLTGPADFPDGKIVVTKFTNGGKKFSKKGDLLITVKGSGTGKVVESDDAYAISRQLMAVRPIKFDFKFTYYNLISSIAHYEGAAAGLIPGISRDDVLHTPVLIPPLPEQKKIAQILSTWDKAITTTEQLLANSQQQKKALMQQLLTGKRRFPEFGGDWRDMRLADIAKVIVSPVDKKTIEGESSVELCNYTDVYYNTYITRKLDFMKATATKVEIEKWRVRIGDVVITKDSETPGDIAVSALVNEDLHGVVCGYHLAIVRPTKGLVDGAFLNFLFSMPSTRYYFFTLATGATRFGLSIGSISKAHFKMPALKEQQKIASVLSAADREIETLQQKIYYLKQEKKALMQQLLTGKLRVNVEGSLMPEIKFLETNNANEV